MLVPSSHEAAPWDASGVPGYSQETKTVFCCVRSLIGSKDFKLMEFTLVVDCIGHVTSTLLGPACGQHITLKVLQGGLHTCMLVCEGVANTHDL
jgi:hypothetical protein